MDCHKKGTLSPCLFLLFTLIITSNRQTAAKEQHKDPKGLPLLAVLMKNFVKYPQLSTLDHRGITAKLLGQVTNFTAEKYVYHMEQNEKPFVAKDKPLKTELNNRHNISDNSTQFRPLNFSNSKLDWEGGSFPYEDNPHQDNDNVFYDRAVVVAPIVGSVFIIFLVVVGVYLLRQYEIVDLPHGKDVEALCEHCSRTRTSGIRYKIQNYVMRIFDVSNAKQEAYFVQMDPRSRTTGENIEARETLV